MKLVVDMNLSPSWVGRLARHEFEAVHWSTIGAATAPDNEILSWARGHGFVVLTNDLDFSAILAATSGQTPSVVQLRAQDLLSGPAEGLDGMAAGYAPESDIAAIFRHDAERSEIPADRNREVDVDRAGGRFRHRQAPVAMTALTASTSRESLPAGP